MDNTRFERLLDRLAHDIVDAAIFWNLYTDLSALNEDYWREFSQSETFWSLSFQAYAEVALLRLSRIYVGSGGALSLRSWLRNIKNNPQLFPEPPDSFQLEQDIRSVDDDPVVKKLAGFRNRLLAHIDRSNVEENLTLGDRLALSFKEIDLLIERAVAILNQYSILFKGAAWSTNIVGRDDYRTILRTLRRDLERSDAEIAEEIVRETQSVAAIPDAGA